MLRFNKRGLAVIDPKLPVLVVDDYKTTIRIVHNLLKQLGFENLDEAANGVEALEKMKSRRYGLVLSDWNMEPMTGLELLTKVRSDPTLRTVPFVMITAETKPENVAAAKRAGANNFIVKPFTAQTLKDKLAVVAAA
jgi:two-component system chemotaxis response regulator CheY